MKKLIVFIFTSLCFSFQTFCQDSVSLVRYEVSGTGVMVNFPDNPEWSLEWSEDSSKVFSAFTEVNSIGYGAIIVEFSSGLGDNFADWQSMLDSYLAYLIEAAFGLTDWYDPVYTNTLVSGQKSASTFVEGFDVEGNVYYIQGWANKKMLSVMYISFGEYDDPDSGIVNKFLNDVVLP